jgi:hypothetical protein
MQAKRNFRVITELGIALTAISALILVGCGGGSASTGGSNVSSAFINELTNGIGLRFFNFGWTNVKPSGTVNTATANADGTYTLVGSEQTLSSKTWVTASVVHSYTLSTAGIWIANTAPVTLTPNTDGTITFNYAGLNAANLTYVAVNLSGKLMNTGTTFTLPSNPAVYSAASAVVAVGAVLPMDANGYYISNAASSVIAATATYPAGSTEWIATGGVVGQDEYSASADSLNQFKTTGGILTSMITPASAASYTKSNPLCIGSNFRFVYSTTQLDPTNTARFDVYPGGAGTCTTVSPGIVIVETVDFVFTTVSTQPIAQLTNESGMNKFFSRTYPGGWVKTQFIAAPVVNGLVVGVYLGDKTPQGMPYDVYSAASGRATGLKNKTMMDAVMSAAILPTF